MEEANRTADKFYTRKLNKISRNNCDATFLRKFNKFMQEAYPNAGEMHNRLAGVSELYLSLVDAINDSMANMTQDADETIEEIMETSDE